LIWPSDLVGAVQRLVGRVAADIRAQTDGIQILRKEPEIPSVGIVHGQQNTVLMADFRQGSDIGNVPQVVRARQIHGSGALLRQIRFQFLRRQVAGEIAAILGIQPPYLHVQQRSRRS